MRRITVLLGLASAASALAHPMGNFSVNRYAELRFENKAAHVRYVLDLAEIPAFQEMQSGGFAAAADDSKLAAYLRLKGSELGSGLKLIADGNAIPLDLESYRASFADGAGGLPTMRIELAYRADPQLTEGRHSFRYADSNFEGRAGWKEIVFTASDRVRPLGKTADLRDRSAALTAYPADPLASPPQDVLAEGEFEVAARPVVVSMAPVRIEPPTRPRESVAATPPNTPVDRPSMLSPRPATPRNAFTELIAEHRSGFGFLVLAALIAAGLGALHALEPGHGKTIVAAYLVGSRGTPYHALLLGLAVTVSHTAAVYLLGAITLYAQQYVVPERLYPILSVLSGVLVAGTGLYLLLQRFAGEDFLPLHGNGPGMHSHVPRFARASKDEPVNGRGIALLGVTGGMVPCLAALVVMLAAAASHRAGFGLFLIAAFSVGLATVLIAMGLAAVWAGRLMSRVPIDGPVLTRWLPAASALAISALGCAIAVRGLADAGILRASLLGLVG